jgi:hypothetical protein
MASSTPDNGSGPAAVSNLWKPDWSYNYSVRLDNLTTLGGGTLTDFRYTASMELETRQAERGLRVYCRFTGGRFTTPAEAARANFEALAAELEQPMLFTLVNGRVEDLRRAVGATPFAVSLSRTLTAALQVTLAAPDGTSWTAAERDATGEYTAEYKRVADGQVDKRKLSYQAQKVGNAIPGQPGGSLAATVEQSEGRVEWSAGQLTRTAYDEVLSLSSFPGTPARSRTGLELRLQGAVQSARPPAWDSLEQELRVLDPGAVVRSSAVSAAYDDLRISDFTFETALAALEREQQDPDRGKISGYEPDHELSPEEQGERKGRLARQGQVFSALAALLRKDPDNVQKALSAIERGSVGRRALLDVLGAAGSQPAQRALLSVMTASKRPDALRRAATSALARLADPSPETMEAILKQFDVPELRMHALYGAGTLARKLSEAGSTELATRVARQLDTELRKSNTDGERVHVLRAIGNSGNSVAFGGARPLLSSKTPKVRAAAVDAIRLMSHAEADALIVERLLTDADQAVQTAAIEAVRLRKPSPALLTSLGQALRSGAKLPVKLKVLELMGQWRREHSELSAELSRVAEQSTVPKLREAARRALDG